MGGDTRKARCQCDAKCKQAPIKGTPFCKTHTSCPNKSPLSGYEPHYNPKRFDGTRRVRESHNCFSYAFDTIDLPPESECNEVECSTPFPQPGRKSGFKKWDDTIGKRCPDLIARLLADVPGLQLSNFTDKCPKGTSKIALIADPKQDYHFVREDSDGKWSHKPGATHVKRTDALGIPIYNPELACRDYRDGKGGYLNYENFCGFMCAPRKYHKFKRGGSTRKRRTQKRSKSRSKSRRKSR